MSSKEQYINPFSEVSEIYAKKLDVVTLAADFVQLEKLLDEIKLAIPNVGEANQARLYYSIGTVYSDFSKYKGLSYEKSLKKQLYFFRKSVDIIENVEYSKKYMPRMLAVSSAFYILITQILLVVVGEKLKQLHSTKKQ